MISTQEIIDLGWKHFGTMRNGGTKSFTDSTKTYLIDSNADNFIYKRNNSSKLSEIRIRKIENRQFIDLFLGELNTIDELKNVLIKLNINETNTL